MRLGTLGADIGGLEERTVGDVWFTSPCCQIQPAMAFQLGLPILILWEKSVVPEGVLESGVSLDYSSRNQCYPLGNRLYLGKNVADLLTGGVATYALFIRDVAILPILCGYALPRVCLAGDSQGAIATNNFLWRKE